MANTETERMYWESLPDNDNAEGRVSETLVILLNEVSDLKKRVALLEQKSTKRVRR